MAELEVMQPSTLRDRARLSCKEEDGTINEEAIQEAEAAESPKLALIVLIMAAEKAPPPVVVQRKVCLVGARGLKKVDRLGKVDPFAVLTWNHVKVGQSKVIKRTVK